MSILSGVVVLGTHGVPISTDPDPNVTAPTAARIAQAKTAALVVVLDGRGLALQCWVLEPTLSVWFKLDAIIECPLRTLVRLTKIPTLSHFFQVVDNDGGVSQIAVYN